MATNDPPVKRSELEALVEPISSAISELRDTVGQSLAEIPATAKAVEKVAKKVDLLDRAASEDRQAITNLIDDVRAVARTGELAADEPEDLDAAIAELEPPAYGLHEKMARILGLVDGIEKKGHAEVRKDGVVQYAYDYITESDLMAAVRPLLADAGIAVYYSDEILKIDTSARGAMLVHVRAELRLVDGESGEESSLTGEAIAVDYGDKAANKAKTNAVRYLLWKTFLVPSDVDPEQDSISFQADDEPPAEPAHSERVERKTPEPRPARPSQRRANLRKRIDDIAGEVDEIAKREPGSTIAAIADAVRAEYGVDLDTLSDDELVSVGAQARVFLETNRRVATAEPGVYPPGMPDFEIRTQIAAGDQWAAPETKS